MTPANLVSYWAQIAMLVLACAALPRVLGVRSPALQYAFWRVLLGLCLILPFAEPVRYEQMAFVPAPLSAPVAAGPSAGAALPAAPPGRPAGEVIAIAAGMLLLLGAAARLAWLSAGVFRLRRLRNRASERAHGFEDLQRTIGVSPDIRWSADVTHPVAFGILRPIVLLPVAMRAADTASQRAVVVHELHHVRRRDWTWVLGEEIVRSIFWFHPAMWWLVSRVQLARETVVDELSILTTNARRAYLDTLLAFADEGGMTASPAFSARRHLFHRVMLLSKEERMSSPRVAVGSSVLILALGAGSWGAVHAFPMSRTIVVSGAHDQNLPADQITSPQTQTTSDEPPMPAEFKAALERLNPVRLGKDVAPPPAAKKSVKAEYPDEARAAGVQGEVILESIIDTDGKVVAVRVLKSVAALDDAAIAAAKQWEFTPARLNGTPTPVRMTMVMTFRLK